MKILLLPRYVSRGASSRLRLLQYRPVLEAAGHRVVEAPLLDEAYLDALYAGRKPGLWRLARCYLRRVLVLLGAWRFDRIWLEKELWPWVPGWLESWVLRALPAALIDYDDAVFHNYDQHPRALCRLLFGGKIAAVMRGAGCVAGGSHYLLDHAREAGASRIAYLPTVVDLARYAPREWAGERSEARPAFVVGWIGTPFTVKYLDLIVPALSQLASEGVAVELRVIGATAPLVPGVRVRSLPWSAASESAEIADFDVGVMPLEDSLWERGKCAYKLVQYMACAVPVVASPIGMNIDVVGAGENQAGVLAADLAGWVEALRSLQQAPEWRRSLGQRGRERVVAEYSLQAMAPRLLELFASMDAASGV